MNTALKITGISLVVLVVFGGALYAAAHTFDTTKTEHDEVTRSVDHVVIESETGDIEVVSGKRSVEIERTDNYLFDRPDVHRTVDDGVLTIEAECDEVSPFCTTDFRVAVPRGVTVDARTHVGDVRVDAASKTDITARTNVGDVDVQVPRGKYAIDSDTAVGDSDVDGLVASDGARQSIDVRADVGSIDVRAR